MRWWIPLLLFAAFAFAACQKAASKPDAPAPALERVRLNATNEAGIPLHPSPGDSRVSGRIADDTEAELLETSADGRWLRVRSGSLEGWITRRYVVGADAGARPAPKPPAPSVWTSREDCEKKLATRARSSNPEVLRIATWNVRWFPDGKPGKGKSPEEGTDIPWLACAIAHLDVEAIALQEIKTNDNAKARSRELILQLDRLTSGKWRLVTDDCRNRDGQHVGVLVDESRLRVGEQTTLASLNANGEPCKNQLRPGFSAYLSKKSGVDFHLVSVHMKSGDEQRSLSLRQKAIAGIVSAERELQAAVADRDVVIAGDFNTMGCKECALKVTGADEIAETDRTLSGLAVAFRRIPSSAECSERSSHGAALLDHFFVTSSMAELGPKVRAQVDGICRESGCTRSMGLPVETRLSDHCPVVLEITNRDLD
jgi:endonuclease/exonuclease/phosphatase family metal-dependent hydrolase